MRMKVVPEAGGKMVRYGSQSRFFPAITRRPRSPLGACDAALPREEGADDEEDTQEQRDHKAAHAEASAAYDRVYKRALDRRRSLGRAVDAEVEQRGEPSSTDEEEAWLRGRDEHRSDFAPIPSGDSKGGMAQDQGKIRIDADFMTGTFGGAEHPHRNQ